MLSRATRAAPWSPARGSWRRCPARRASTSRASAARCTRRCASCARARRGGSPPSGGRRRGEPRRSAGGAAAPPGPRPPGRAGAPRGRAGAGAGRDAGGRGAALESLALALAAHDPERVVERGYAVVDDRAGGVITSAAAARGIGALRVFFADGAVHATTDEEGT